MTRSLRHIIPLAILSAGLGIGIVIVMMRVAHIDLQSLLQSLKRARPLALLAVLLITLFHLWITSLKWRLITESASEADRLHGNFFVYTVVSSLLGQLLPHQIAAVTVRTLAGRLHQRTGVTRGAGLAVLDQFMDLLIPAALLLPSVLCLTHRLRPWTGAFIALATLAGIAIFLSTILKAIARLASHAHGFLARTIRVELSSATLPPRSTLWKLFALSIIRYSNLAIRYYVLALCINTPVSLPTIIQATSIVTLIFLLSITPGALGVAELGWVGVLSAGGLAPAAAVQYAVSIRILIFMCVGMIAIVTLAIIVLFRPSRIKPMNDEASTAN